MFLAYTYSKAYLKDDPNMLNIVHTVKKLTKKESRIAQLKLTIQSDTELNTMYHYCKKCLAGSYSKSSNQSDNLQLKTKKRGPQLPCIPPK
ncbi:hypothetical protein NPIL_145221 [Nephila pilipes]|uniref:Uncharacterized protein n=1 Tax=Nephila pilipes TaxID=299642 RepID=A0A8X6QVJ9_NEPPI|nr:hypothetical protein NPIL_57541 [Nephila pilipes]GFU38661.1 hypothetical protein NPIL_145221 [Nephila pilipes]